MQCRRMLEPPQSIFAQLPQKSVTGSGRGLFRFRGFYRRLMRMVTIPAVDHFAVAGTLIDKATKGLVNLHLAGLDQDETCRRSLKEREARVGLAAGIGLDYLLHCTVELC